MSPDPAVAAVRLAVRHTLRLLDARDGVRWSPRLPDGSAVLLACSGGADSLALLAATVFELRRTSLRVVGVVVDHGLQDGSAEHTARVVDQMAGLGVDETVSARVTVHADGHGVEAAAREARYAVLEQVAASFDAPTVLLGHTLDDQAETVLLGLARGAGGRSIAGMRPAFRTVDDGASEPRADHVWFERPLLGIRRAQTEAACRAEGIEFWTDPHNSDPRFLRARVRHDVLPVLERELGPGVAETLARTAEQLRPDMEALDSRAESEFERAREETGLADTSRLETLEWAVKTRVVRRAALAAGCPPADLAFGHVTALADLLWGDATASPQQVRLPGSITARRDGNHLRFGPTPPMPPRDGHATP